MLKTKFRIEGTSLKSINISLIDQGLVSGSNFISALLIVRVIGLEAFGVFTTCWLILLFLNTIFVASIVSPMMSLISGEKDKRLYEGSLLVMGVALALSFVLISFLVSNIYLASVNNYSILLISSLFSVVVFTHHLQDFIRRLFFMKKQFKNALLIDFLTYIPRIVIIYFFIMSSKDIELEGVFLVYLITAFIGGAVGATFVKPKFNLHRIKIDVIRHFEIGKWLVLSGMLKWSSINLFFVASSILLGPIQIGILKLSQNIVSVYNLFLLGLENVIPVESGKVFHEKGFVGLVFFIKRILLFGSVLTAVFGSVLIVFSDQILLVIYGPEYVEYAFILFWFSGFLVFMFILSILNIFHITINKPKVMFKGYLLTSVFSLIIFYPLIQYYQILGVLLGIGMTYIVLVFNIVWISKKSVQYENF